MVAFGGSLEEAGLLFSIGSVADAYDNAPAEFFVFARKRDLLHHHSWPSWEGVRVDIFECIEALAAQGRGTPRWVRWAGRSTRKLDEEVLPWLKSKRSAKLG